MPHSKHNGRAIRVILLLIGCGVCGAVAQTAPAAAARPPLTAPAAGDAHRAVLTDADNLLLLARRLKASVVKTRRDELSMQVIREADEIEKLARSTKARIH